jgi:hypothetical protein
MSRPGSASVFTYVLPEEENVAQPTVEVDHDWLHLDREGGRDDVRVLPAGQPPDGGHRRGRVVLTRRRRCPVNG